MSLINIIILFLKIWISQCTHHWSIPWYWSFSQGTFLSYLSFLIIQYHLRFAERWDFFCKLVRWSALIPMMLGFTSERRVFNICVIRLSILLQYVFHTLITWWLLSHSSFSEWWSYSLHSGNLWVILYYWLDKFIINRSDYQCIYIETDILLLNQNKFIINT